MSIIERTNPINLQYRICIVTSAASPLGTIICKTLLKANAFVVGVDSKPHHDSLTVNAFTHFQFLEKDVNDPDTPEKAIELGRYAFRREAMSVLVNVVEPGKEGEIEGIKRMTSAVGKVMQDERNGVIINVVGGDKTVDEGKAKPIVDYTKEIASQFKGHGVRCNVIVPEEGQQSSQLAKAYENAKSYMSEIMAPSKNPTQPGMAAKGEPKHYDVGNLTLYLAGDLSEEISGSVVRLDGSYK